VFIGRQFRDRVFIGFNPFGSQERIAASYTGWLNVAKAGKHVFASSSRDASFLLIDDKVVVDNGGIHQPQQDVSKHGEVELAAGLHKLTFYHVVTRGAPVAVAAWQPPGETKIAPIPAKAFAPVVTMESAPLEQYGREGIIDFLPRFAGECSHGGGYSERFVFEALPAKSGYTYEWDFGDGQKSVQAKASHVYLAGGEYKVTLTAKTPYGPQTRTNVLAVDRPWEQLADIKPEPLKTHQDVVATYDFAALSAEACARALIVLDGLDQTDTVVRAGKALTARPQAPAELLGEAMRVYCAALRKARDPGAAVSACVAASKMTANPAVSAEMLVGGGKVALSMGSKEDLRVAEDLFQQTIRKYETMTTAPPIRQAKIGLGDVWRARGDYDKAREAYVGARLGPEAQSGKYAIIRGDFARHVEDYVRKAELWSAQEYLDRWENTFPLDKLEGYWSLLTVRVDMAHKRWHEAITEAQTLVGVNPTSNYAAELLLLVADCHQELRQYDKAAAALRQVADNYRESPLAAEASQRLAKMPASAPTKAAPAAGKPSTQP
jgi:TolA-binding protein